MEVTESQCLSLTTKTATILDGELNLPKNSPMLIPNYRSLPLDSLSILSLDSFIILVNTDL